MAYLIDKSALLAEINKLYNGEIDTYTRNILDRLKSNIDTLEVKEVDLEKKETIDKACWWLNNNRLGVIDDDYIKEFRKAINN